MAVEEDHIPARHMFRGREWPEGYVFPACSACNDASASDELAMGWLARIRVTDLTADDEKELTAALVKLHDRRPDWINGMREMSRVETRRYLRERGLSLDSFRGIDFGLVEMPLDLLQVPTRYGQKLGKALHYLHTRRIVSAGAKIETKVFPNTTFLSDQFPLDAFSPLQSMPIISRAGKSLDSQFNYRYATTPEHTGSVFFIQFGESVVLAIFVFESAAALDERLARRLAEEIDSA